MCFIFLEIKCRDIVRGSEHHSIEAGRVVNGCIDSNEPTFVELEVVAGTFRLFMVFKCFYFLGVDERQNIKMSNDKLSNRSGMFFVGTF